jgi:hypothetical protein
MGDKPTRKVTGHIDAGTASAEASAKTTKDALEYERKLHEERQKGPATLRSAFGLGEADSLPLGTWRPHIASGQAQPTGGAEHHILGVVEDVRFLRNELRDALERINQLGERVATLEAYVDEAEEERNEDGDAGGYSTLS